MKNSNFFPFERNKYFYGKLLSVDDFELEQKYMNDKRRMLNCFILGTGVVAGLYVVRTDEQTISVEAGVALDSWGREIVVDVPVMKKLSLIEGFGDCSIGDTGDVYLCLEYDEGETDQVHNIAGNAAAGQGLSFNKIREGYRLFLTGREPEENMLSPSGWYQASRTVYQEGDIKITQVMPRYIRAGGTAEIKIQVENRGRSNVSFSYELVLNCLLSDGKAKVGVSFNEALFERTGRYEITYPVQASGQILEEGTAVIDPETVSFRLSGARQEVQIEGKMAARIVDKDEKEAVQEEYYRSSMGKIVRTGYKQPVYLARIHVVSAMDTYIIERIENVPFGQYVSNHVMETALYQMMKKELLSAGGGGGRQRDTGARTSQFLEREGVRIAQGVTEIRLGEGGQRGQKFFSPEIVHGLGLGKITVILGLEKESGKVVYGSAEIFEEDREKGIDAELAACVNEANGSFVVGVRLLSGTLGGEISVHWVVLKDRKDAIVERNEKRIFIKPNLLELTVRQSQYLEAVCENMVEKAVSWSVKDEGGFIDENGLYTAPNIPGVYEVVAQSVAFPEIRASVFVVVRDAGAIVS